MSNKNPHVGILAVIALTESAKLAEFHNKVFKVVRSETDGKHLPEPLVVEMVADSMTKCIINSDSPLTEQQKRTYIRAAFRSLTCDVLSNKPDLLTTPLVNSEEEKEAAKNGYYSKESDDANKPKGDSDV